MVTEAEKRLSTSEEFDLFKIAIAARIAVGKEGIGEDFISSATEAVINDVVERATGAAVRSGNYITENTLKTFFDTSYKVKHTDRGAHHYGKALTILTEVFREVATPETGITDIMALSPERSVHLGG
ncbi:MAG: hypothetical protein U1E36_07300 [Rickettsiales bacterium]